MANTIDLNDKAFPADNWEMRRLDNQYYEMQRDVILTKKWLT